MIALPIHRLAILAALVQTVIAVANGFIIKATVGELGPVTLTMLRLVGTGAVVVLYWLLFPARRPRLTRPDWLRAAGLGVLGVTLNQALYIIGLAHSTPARAVLIYALTPLLVLLIGAYLGRERLTPWLLVGITAGFAGVTTILSEEQLRTPTLTGDLLLLAGTLCWTLYTAGAQRLLHTYGAFVITQVALVAGALVALPLGWPALVDLPWSAVSSSTWLGVGYVIVFASLGAYWLWYFAIQHLTPSRTAMFSYLQPMMTVLIAALMFHERLSARFMGGGAVILVGLLSAQRERSVTPRPVPTAS